VSLNGSPTVSPTTAARCASERLPLRVRPRFVSLSLAQRKFSRRLREQTTAEKIRRSVKGNASEF